MWFASHQITLPCISSSNVHLLKQYGMPLVYSIISCNLLNLLAICGFKILSSRSRQPLSNWLPLSALPFGFIGIRKNLMGPVRILTRLPLLLAALSKTSTWRFYGRRECHLFFNLILCIVVQLPAFASSLMRQYLLPDIVLVRGFLLWTAKVIFSMYFAEKWKVVIFLKRLNSLLFEKPSRLLAIFYSWNSRSWGTLYLSYL